MGFSGSQLSLNESLALIAELTAMIESNAPESEQYVCWGTFRHCDPNNLHELPLLGDDHYFTPNLALRSTLFINRQLYSDLILREWKLDRASNLAEHRAGVRIRFETPRARSCADASIEILEEGYDGALFHDQYFPETMDLMAGIALNLLQVQPREART